MKKIITLMIAVVVLLAGCGTSDLEAYRSAVELTDSYASGSTETDMTINLTFNEEGLSQEAIRDLSYYEKIEYSTKTSYNGDNDQFAMMSDIYFNFGGLGFDMVYYFGGEEFLVKIPILDKYMSFGEGFASEESANPVNDQQANAIGKMIDTWNAVLGEEDVFSGNKAYVMTDKGQIKTTTYTIHIDEGQFETLKAAMMEIIDEEGVLEAFLVNAGPMVEGDLDPTEIRTSLKDFIRELELKSFQGEAHVDFDGRLVRQNFEAELIDPEPDQGDISTIAIAYSVTFDELGHVEAIQFPTISDEDMLKLEDGETINDQFPETLF